MIKSVRSHHLLVLKEKNSHKYQHFKTKYILQQPWKTEATCVCQNTPDFTPMVHTLPVHIFEEFVIQIWQKLWIAQIPVHISCQWEGIIRWFGDRWRIVQGHALVRCSLTLCSNRVHDSAPVGIQKKRAGKFGVHGTVNSILCDWTCLLEVFKNLQ